MLSRSWFPAEQIADDDANKQNWQTKLDKNGHTLAFFVLGGDDIHSILIF
jgi:hypothetical protein